MANKVAQKEALTKLDSLIGKAKALHYILGTEADEQMVPALAALRELETRLEQGEFEPKRPYKNRIYTKQF